MGKPVFIYRFDYDLNNEQWHCYIAGYSQDESQEYLMTIAPNAVVTQVSQEFPLHAISDEVRKTIVDSVKRPPGRPKGSTKAKAAEN